MGGLLPTSPSNSNRQFESNKKLLFLLSLFCSVPKRRRGERWLTTTTHDADAHRNVIYSYVAVARTVLGGGGYRLSPFW